MFEKPNLKDTMLLEEIVRLLRRQNDSLDRLNNMLEEIARNNDWLNDDDDDLDDWDDDDEDLKALLSE